MSYLIDIPSLVCRGPIKTIAHEHTSVFGQTKGAMSSSSCAARRCNPQAAPEVETLEHWPLGIPLHSHLKSSTATSPIVCQFLWLGICEIHNHGFRLWMVFSIGGLQEPSTPRGVWFEGPSSDGAEDPLQLQERLSSCIPAVCVKLLEPTDMVSKLQISSQHPNQTLQHTTRLWLSCYVPRLASLSTGPWIHTAASSTRLQLQ